MTGITDDLHVFALFDSVILKPHYNYILYIYIYVGDRV